MRRIGKTISSFFWWLALPRFVIFSAQSNGKMSTTMRKYLTRTHRATQFNSTQDYLTVIVFTEQLVYVLKTHPGDFV